MNSYDALAEKIAKYMRSVSLNNYLDFKEAVEHVSALLKSFKEDGK